MKGLCSGCEPGEGNCRTPAEPGPLFDQYYGDVSALRCLIRRKGDVAFIRSSAVSSEFLGPFSVKTAWQKSAAESGIGEWWRTEEKTASQKFNKKVLMNDFD